MKGPLPPKKRRVQALDEPEHQQAGAIETSGPAKLSIRQGSSGASESKQRVTNSKIRGLAEYRAPRVVRLLPAEPEPCLRPEQLLYACDLCTPMACAYLMLFLQRTANA